jgi:anti-sigma factor RsiW
MTAHNAYRLQLHAYADGELDAAGAQAFETHLASCANCRAELAAVRDLKQRLAALPHEDLPPRLAADVRAALHRQRAMSWRWPLAGGLMAAGLAAALLVLPGMFVPVTSDLVSSHVRSLDGGHLVAVASSDHDAVKPWFTARIGFAPPVLARVNDCALVGGRVDAIAHRTAAAMAYRCGGHVVNFYAMSDHNRSAGTPATDPRLAAARGYRVVSWKRGRLDCYAVSDLAGPQLLAFARFIEAHAQEG